ncbi:MAG TPA: hypothetical protein VGH70_13580 [Bradyrhizobium sp.]
MAILAELSLPSSFRSPVPAEQRRQLLVIRRAMLELEEEIMPVILLWGIPTLIVVGGGAFWLIHAHH